MALTSSLFTGLSGLTANSRMLSVAGDNIANVNTHGFKASHVRFETSIQQNLRSASAPTANLGGTNPTQIGFGVKTASITRNFETGSLQPTGVNTDLAIEGDGFFVVRDNGVQRYTRTGNFDLDSDYNLVTASGGNVLGAGVDANFNILDGVNEPLNIPLGSLTVAEPTREVRLTGNLNAAGDVATRGSISTSGPLYTDPAATSPAGAGTALASLHNASGTPLFAAGDVITLSGAAKGGAELPDKTFEIGGSNTTDSDASGTTLGDLTSFLEATLGIDTSLGGGIDVDAAGQLVVNGNPGTANSIEFDPGDIFVSRPTGTTTPFSWTQTQDADGESVRTGFVAYDSLGSEMTIDVTAVLENRDDSGTTWRIYAQSDDDSDLARALSTSTLQFGPDGRLLAADNTGITIDRGGSGAGSPQQIELLFSDNHGSTSALASESSTLATLNQDGSPIGTLVDFSVNEDGSIMGVFSNSQLRPLGRVALARFSNPEGLVLGGGSMYDLTTNSGTAQVGPGGTAGLGRIVGGALEQSNVELSEEFITLISASTGFSANSRVITTSDELIRELLAAVR